MLNLTIKNPGINRKVAALVNETVKMITRHWCALLPSMVIVISRKPFNKVPELRGFCREENKQPGLFWKKEFWPMIQVICSEFKDKQATLWIYYDRKSMMFNPDYYFKKELFGVIAKILWLNSEELRKEAVNRATGMASNSEALTYMAFRDSFSRFFLNPEYLQERKEDAWVFIKGLDETLSL